MKAKRFWSAVMAGVMAVNTAIVCSAPVSAADDVVISGEFNPASSKYIDKWNNNQYVHQSVYPVDDFSAISDVKISLNVTETNAHVTAVKCAIIDSSWNWVDGTSQTIDVSSSGVKTATIDLTSLSEDLLATCNQVLFRVETDSSVEEEVSDFGFTVKSIIGTSADAREWEETTVWTGSARKPEISDFDFSKLSEEAVFVVTLNTASDSDGYTKGWGIGNIVANDVWDGAVTLSSPGPDMTGATVSFKLADLLSTSGESALNKLTVQLYKADTIAAVTKITVKDVLSEVVAYNVIVNSAITNGKVTADKETAEAGDEVTLTVTPETGYKLKADSLKVTKKGDSATTVAVTDNKFTMPGYDVEITAEFEKIAVESVSVKEATSLVVGGTETLVATVAPSDAFDTTVTWKSSDEAIATVDATGKVTAVKAGTATITATAGEKSAECKVTVADKTVPATGVTVDPATAELEVGKTVTLSGTVTPTDSTDKITWKSSDEAVATVDATGKVTAVKAGTATITATAGEKSAECKVTVKAPTGYTSEVEIAEGKIAVQKTAVVEGKYSERFVQRVKAEDVAKASEVIFTLSNGTKTVTASSTKYYSSLNVNGNKADAGDGYVLLSFTIKDIPEGVTVTCTKVEIK